MPQHVYYLQNILIFISSSHHSFPYHHFITSLFHIGKSSLRTNPVTMPEHARADSGLQCGSDRFCHAYGLQTFYLYLNNSNIIYQNYQGLFITLFGGRQLDKQCFSVCLSRSTLFDCVFRVEMYVCNNVYFGRINDLI